MMLRTSMGEQGLADVFQKMGKTVSKANAHQLGAIACAAPEIFLAPASGPLRAYMCGDLRCLYCLSRGMPLGCQYTYWNLVGDVLNQYGLAEYTDADTLKAIFEALDDKIAAIKHLLEKDGFPPLR